jgi:hypothetical protein
MKNSLFETNVYTVQLIIFNLFVNRKCHGAGEACNI